jgi:carbon monoxide dehydrogenase subunit G
MIEGFTFCEAFFLQSRMTLNYNISKPVEAIYASLAQMDNFVCVHPVVYKVECIGKNEFIFYEKIKFLFIPFDFNYKVNVDILEKNKNITMSSVVRKGVHLNLEFLLVQNENSTEVIEKVSIKANIFVRMIFENVLRRVHKKMFLNIENK